MKLGQLVLTLRANNTTFSNRIGGAAEYAFAREGTLRNEMAFVLPLQETADPNQYDNIVNQKLTEQFAVVVAIKNDTNFEDKTGFTAYNRLHNIRKELFQSFLGLDVGTLHNTDDGYTTESLIYYRGGQLLDFDRSYLWYQFTFEYNAFIESSITPDDSNVGYFDDIFIQWELQPSENLPTEETLPISLFTPDLEELIQLDELRIEKDSREYGKGFTLAFDIKTQ